MPLSIPDGSVCFIDVNFLVYHFIRIDPALSEASTLLLRRIMAGEIIAVSTLHVLSDVIHKVMSEEVRLKFHLTTSGVIYLRRNPRQIAELSIYLQAVEQLRCLPLQIIAGDIDVLAEAARLSREHGLLTSDATILALRYRHNIEHIATNDDDFDRVPGLRVWKPR